MLERMYEEQLDDWYDDDYGVYVVNELVSGIEGYRAESMTRYLNEEISDYLCGQVSLTSDLKRVIEYHYITEDVTEVEFFDKIKEDINKAIDRFRYLH
jgi:hypothetical protein